MNPSPKQNEPLIWIIDSQQWTRALMRAELINRGFETIGFETINQALAAYHHPDFQKPHLIILELFGSSFRPGDFIKLASLKAKRILLGGIVQLNNKQVKRFRWHAIFRRPFTVGSVADMVGELLKKREGDIVPEKSRWVKFEMVCPEGKGEAGLLLEWRSEGRGETLNSISCDNPVLRDLSGSECQWSCWEEILQKKP